MSEYPVVIHRVLDESVNDGPCYATEDPRFWRYGNDDGDFYDGPTYRALSGNSAIEGL